MAGSRIIRRSRDRGVLREEAGRAGLLSRRSALKALGGLSLTPVLAHCGVDAKQAKPLHESIDRVVILMMENRSFDHYFGALSLHEGRTDIDGLVAGMMNPRLDGTPEAIHPIDLKCVPDPPHSWVRSHAQWNEGLNDGFVRTYEQSHGEGVGAHAMQYCDRSILPVSYALADAQVLCQRWYCSLMSSTWPNRFYSHAAENNGVRGNDFYEYDLTHIYDRLEEAGLSWNCYASNIAFMTVLSRVGHGLTNLEQFFDDAAAGTLPNVSIVEPFYGMADDHPPAHPVAGQVFISSIYEALAKSPQWNRSMFVVTYDEHGGFFDHVSPPKAADARAAEGFDQLGFRVPSIVAGPYVRPHVSNTVFDHTSMLAFIEHLFGLAAITERDAAANDLTDLLDTTRLEENAPAAPTSVPVVEADDNELYAPECTNVYKSAGEGPASSTGQVELEGFLDRLPSRHHADRRHQQGALFDEFLRRAERRGLLRRR